MATKPALTNPARVARNVRPVLAVTAVSCLLLAIASSLIPQGLYTDPSWQLKALQQWRTGQSKNINSLVQPDPANLARDKAEWISWWSLSVPALTAPLLGLGLSVGSAMRVLSLTSLIVGALGWALWSSRIITNSLLLSVVAGLIPFLHYAVQPLFFFSTESFVFAAVPWLILAVVHVRESDSISKQLLVGIFAGSLYFLKYSAVFVTLGCCLYLLLRQRGIARFLVGLAAGLPIAALTLLNRYMGGAGNLVLASIRIHFSWPPLLAALGNPALIVADLDAMLRRLLFFPSHRLLNSELWLPAIGLVGGAWIIWVVLSQKARTEAAELAFTLFLTGVGALFVCWSVSSGVSFEARHLAGCTLPLLPVVISEVLARRGLLHFTMLTIFVAAPLAYGPITLPIKILQEHRMIRGSSGIYNSAFADSDVAAVIRTLCPPYDPKSDIWYIDDPISSLDIPGRAIIRPAAFDDLSRLESDRFVNHEPMRALVLLSSDLEASGRAKMIKRSFVNAEHWTVTPIPESPYRLWVGTLRPN